MLKTANLATLAKLASEITGTTVTLRVEGSDLRWDLPYEPLCRGFTCLGAVDGDLRRVFNSYKAWRNFFSTSLVPLKGITSYSTATDLERQVYGRMRGGK